jgi:hypothetical protein
LPAAGRPGRFRQWWLDRSVRAKGLIVVAVPLIALIGTSASLALQYQERQERAAAHAAFDLINAADQVLVDAINAETGIRGYAATRGPPFLGPYRRPPGGRVCAGSGVVSRHHVKGWDLLPRCAAGSMPGRSGHTGPFLSAPQPRQPPGKC